MSLPRHSRAARYIRVSRSDQAPGLQLDETLDFIERRGWRLDETYQDHGVSGSKTNRPALGKLLKDAKRKRFDVLVVWRSDRLFRSTRHMVNTLAELDAWGIHFVSVTEPFDTTTPQGRLLFTVVSAFAEFERDLLIERTKSGMQAAQKRGAQIGRPSAHVDLTQVTTLRAKGYSWRKTATELGVSVTTLRRKVTAAEA